MISLTGRRIVRRIRSTWTCSFPFGKNSAMARTKKLFCKRQRSPKSSIAFIKPVLPTPWRCSLDIILGHQDLLPLDGEGLRKGCKNEHLPLSTSIPTFPRRGGRSFQPAGTRNQHLFIAIRNNRSLFHICAQRGNPQRENQRRLRFHQPEHVRDLDG